MSILWNQLKKDVKSVGQAVTKAVDFIPGGRAAQGWGNALSINYINKLDKQSVAQGQQLESTLNNQINQSKSQEEKQRLLQIKQNYLQTTPSVLAEGIKGAPTNKQIIASSVDLALTAALGLSKGATMGTASKGATALGRITPLTKTQIRSMSSLAKEIGAVKMASKLRSASRIGQVAIKTGADVGKYAKNIAIGAGLFGVAELHMNRDASVQDVVDSAKTGAIVSAAIPVAGKFLGLGAKFVSSAARKTVGVGAEKMMNKIRAIAESDYTKLAQEMDIDPNKILKIIDGHGDSLKKRMAQKTVEFIDSAKKLKANWLDRFAEIQPLEERIAAVKGEMPSASERLYTQVRTLEDRARNVADEYVTKFNEKLKPYAKIEDDVKTYLMNLDLIDRGKLDNKLALGLKLEDVLANYKRQMEKLSPEVRAKVVEAGNIIRQSVDDYLTKRVDSGILTKEAVQLMREAHPNYIPHRVILDEEIKALSKLTSNSLNVSKTEVFKAVGSIRKLEDPILALKKMFYTTEHLLHRNQFINNLVETQKKYNIIEGMKPLETAEKFFQRLEALKGLRFLADEKRKISKVIKSGNKKYQAVTSKMKDQMNKVESLLEKISLENVDNVLPTGKLNKYFERYERYINKYNEVLTDAGAKQADLLNSKATLEKLKGMSQDLLADLNLVKKEIKQTGEETISYFKNGVLERWVVPNDIAYAIKNLNQEVTTGFLKTITAPMRVWKSWVTTNNISFAVKNKARDEQTAFVISESLIDEFQKRYGLGPKALNMSSKEIMDLYRKKGGYGGGLFDEATDKLLPKFEQTGIMRVLKEANPLTQIKRINEQMEISTRLKVFEKALKGGLPADQAALIARDATIDFSKMGDKMKALNQAIPFLNARVQAVANMGRAAVNNPEQFMRLMANTSVYPTLLLTKHNSEYESYKNISQDIKNRNWIIMTGETEAFVDGNRILVPQMFTLPKGEIQQIIASPLQFILDRNMDIDKRKVTEMLGDTIANIDPVGIDMFGSDNMLGQLFSNFGPFATLPGLYANKHTFFGTPIVPQGKESQSKSRQYKETTPNVIKDVVKIFNEKMFGKDTTKGISPAEVEYVLQSMGGLPQDILTMTEKIYNKSNDFDAVRNPLSNTLFGEMTTYPVLRGFMREDRGMRTSSIDQEREVKKEAEAREADISGMKREMIESQINKLDGMVNAEERKVYLINQLNLGNLTSQDIIDITKKIKTKQMFGTLRETDSDEVKAQVIAYKMAEIEDPEKKKEILKELVESGMAKVSTIQAYMKTEFGTTALAIARDLQEMDNAEQKKEYLRTAVLERGLDLKTLENALTIIEFESSR